ncbi:MAG: DUF433 domain-containing protein [Pedosphaera sp.]|nr:DUF433 domain-containing protein [Pedosphaera sp.]
MQATAPERITIDPRVCHGKPVIRGTRVPVSVVTGSLAGRTLPGRLAIAGSHRALFPPPLT